MAISDCPPTLLTPIFSPKHYLEIPLYTNLDFSLGVWRFPCKYFWRFLPDFFALRGQESLMKNRWKMTLNYWLFYLLHIFGWNSVCHWHIASAQRAIGVPLMWLFIVGIHIYSFIFVWLINLADVYFEFSDFRTKFTIKVEVYMLELYNDKLLDLFSKSNSSEVIFS